MGLSDTPAREWMTNKLRQHIKGPAVTCGGPDGFSSFDPYAHGVSSGHLDLYTPYLGWSQERRERRWEMPEEYTGGGVAYVERPHVTYKTRYGIKCVASTDTMYGHKDMQLDFSTLYPSMMLPSSHEEWLLLSTIHVAWSKWLATRGQDNRVIDRVSRKRERDETEEEDERRVAYIVQPEPRTRKRDRDDDDDSVGAAWWKRERLAILEQEQEQEEEEPHTRKRGAPSPLVGEVLVKRGRA